MNDNTTFRNKVIGFYSNLSYNGIHISVNKKLFDTPEERKEFERHIKNERDVVTISYI